VDAQQVLEGGGGTNKCYAGGITVLYWWLSVFLEFMQQGLPGFAEVESHISVEVIWTSALVILHPPALEDGTDRGFRNVGF
jgi:hypothetical protein